MRNGIKTHKSEVREVLIKINGMICPFMTTKRSTVMHNRMQSNRTAPIAYNNVADNDVTLEEMYMHQCMGPDCMAFDMDTLTCKRCRD